MNVCMFITSYVMNLQFNTAMPRLHSGFYVLLCILQILQDYRSGWKVNKSSVFQFKVGRMTASLKEKQNNGWQAGISGQTEVCSFCLLRFMVMHAGHSGQMM